MSVDTIDDIMVMVARESPTIEEYEALCRCFNGVILFSASHYLTVDFFVV